MKAFVIDSWGTTHKGIPLLNGHAIEVGEPGRGRRYVRVPVPKGAQIEDGRLTAIPARFSGALVLIQDQSGVRGTWELVNSQGEPIEPSSLGIIVAEGRKAEGAAGRMGGGPEYLAAFRAGSEFYIHRSGRLYGDPDRLRVRVGADAIEVKAARDIAAEEQASKAFRALEE